MDSNMFSYPTWLTNKKDTDSSKHKAAALVKQIEHASVLSKIKTSEMQIAARELIEDAMAKMNQACFTPGMEFELYNLLALYAQKNGEDETYTAMLLKAAAAIKKAS